jgi:hypothetical protein
MKSALGCLILLLFAAPCFAQAEWTLMFYMDLDNNLEAAQLDDIDEMLAAGGTKDVNVALLVDRSAKDRPELFYSNRAIGNLKNWTTAKLLYVEKGNLRELADWGELNMGSPANLKRFLQTVAQQFPARRNAVVFTNHGAGWSGIVGDESANGDTLSTKELPLVLKDAGLTFDLIGFDACLMGNLEVAKAVAPFGRVMVASEELEPDDGWNYTPLLRALAANPKMDAAALGQTMVATYADYFKSPARTHTGKGVTLSALALDKIAPLENAVNQLAARNQSFMKTSGRAAFLSTARARAQTEECGNDTKNDYRYNYYDLGDYAQNIKAERPDPETARAADAVTQALNAAVITQHSGQAHPNASGLAIFFPPDTKTLKFKGEIGYKDTPFALAGKWLPFLNDYANLRLTDTEAPQIQSLAIAKKRARLNRAPVILPAEDRTPKAFVVPPFGGTSVGHAQLDEPPHAGRRTAALRTYTNHLGKLYQTDVATVTARVRGDDVDEVDFVLAETDGDEQLIYGSVPTEPDASGLLREEWDGSWLKISDGQKELFAPITDYEELDDDEDLYWIEIPAQVRLRDDNQWRDVTLYFLLDKGADPAIGEFVYAFEFADSGVREIELDAGDALRPVYLLIDQNGDEQFIAPDDPADILRIKNLDDLTLKEDDVEPGDYLLGFTVSDFAGNFNEKYEQWTVE